MVSEKSLRFMLSHPEEQFVELKRSVSSSVDREIVAFANSGGGHIIVGVDSDILLKRAYEGVGEGVNEGVKLRLSKELIEIHARESITRRDIEKLFNVSTATTERDIAMLKDVNLIRFEGPPKTGKYVLTEKGKKMIEEAK